MIEVKYPWHRPRSGPTPNVLWVCAGCGEAFWAIDVVDRRLDRRYACQRTSCPRSKDGSAVRRATASETAEAEKHIALDGGRATVDHRPHGRKFQADTRAHHASKRVKVEANVARKAARAAR